MEMVPIPTVGRRFVAARRVRWGDADPTGRLRLDGIARYLQDIGNDDTRDVGQDPSAPWVVRRTVIDVASAPRAGEILHLTTFCGGLGSRWAERRTSMLGDRGGSVEASSLWVHIDPASGRPARLPAAFVDAYGEAAGGREVPARLLLPAPPAGAPRRPWPLRATDLDGLAHVNNAATWEPVEDEVIRRRVQPRRAVLEYGDAIERDDEVDLVWTEPADGRLSMWLTVGDKVRAAALVDVLP